MNDPLLHELATAPWRFEIEAAWGILVERFGREAVLDGTTAWFGGWDSFAFPPAALLAQAPRNEDDPLELIAPSLSLYGAVGPLPHFWTQEIHDAADRHNGDTTLRDFLDVFNHRLVALYCLAAGMGCPASSDEANSDDPLLDFVNTLFGVTAPPGLPPEILVRYGALIAAAPGKAALVAVLTDYFDVEVTLRSPQEICHSDLATMEECWADFYLEIGPLTHDRYLAFLPGGNACLFLLRLTRFFLGVEPRFGLRLLLRPEGRDRCVEGGELLGWTSWLLGDENSIAEGIVSAAALHALETRETGDQK